MKQVNRWPYGAVRIYVKPEPAPTVARVSVRTPEHDDFDWDQCWNDWNWRIAELKVKATTEVEV